MATTKPTRSGGAWRAFVHINSKRNKFTGAKMQELAEAYRNLSPEQAEWYALLGKQATMSHRQGGQTFPAYSLTAKYERGSASSTELAGEARQRKRNRDEDSLDVTIRDAARDLRAREKRRQAELDLARAELKAFNARELPSFLQQRRVLNMDACQWFAIPHTCSGVLCTFKADKIPPEVLQAEHSISSLASQWEARHVGVRQTDLRSLGRDTFKGHRLDSQGHFVWRWEDAIAEELADLTTSYGQGLCSQ